MRIFVFGATGYIGGHVAARLAADGHEVSAFVRSDKGREGLEAKGIRPVLGHIDDPAIIQAFSTMDAVVWAAQVMLEDEQRLVSSFLDALAGTGKAFIFTSGTSLLSKRTDGEWDEDTYSEDDSFVPRRHVAPRLTIENTVREAAARNIRAMCIRPPLVWGNGGSKIISDLYHSARMTGAVCYVGRGLNLYSNIHVDDLADLFSKAINNGVGGALYHCVSGEVNYRTMAETIARHLGVPSRSVTVAEAAEIWDRFMAPIVYAGCSRTRCPRSRRELRWTSHPDRRDILQDCVNPAYGEETDRGTPSWVRPADAGKAVSETTSA